MNKIYLYGNTQEKPLYELIQKISGQFLNKQNFQIIPIDKTKSVDFRGSVVVMESESTLGNEDTFPGDVLVIANAENSLQLKSLLGKCGKIITCGMSQKDTVTYSSKTDDDAVTALMRTVKNIRGETVLPFEMHFKFNGKYSDYHILAAAALIVLLDLNKR